MTEQILDDGECFEVTLEKKGRARGLQMFLRPWAVRTFRLTGHSLSYFDGNEVLKGTVDISGSSCFALASSEVDGRPFGFAIKMKAETLLLNAISDRVRQRCIEKFNHVASNVPNSNHHDMSYEELYPNMPMYSSSTNKG